MKAAQHRALLHLQRASDLLGVDLPFHRVDHVPQHRQHLLYNPRPLLGIVQIGLGQQALKERLNHRQCALDQPHPLVGVAADQFIGIISGGQAEDADLRPQATLEPHQPTRVEDRLALPYERLPRNLQAAQGGLHSGSIRVERQHEATGESLQPTDLSFGQGSSHLSHNVAESLLIGPHHIHVPFDDHDAILLPDRLSRQVEPKQRAALIEEGSLGRVDVLRHPIGIQGAGPEPDHTPTWVPDGNHQPVAEAVVAGTVLPLDQQPRRDQLRHREVPFP